VETEELDDPAVTAALAAAARRGVGVRITMTADPEWDPALTELARAGVHIRLYPNDSNALYIHAKAIVADAGLPGQHVLVGSQNFSVASLEYNQELGIRTRNPAVIAAVSAALASDCAGASRYTRLSRRRRGQAHGVPPPPASTTPPTTRTTSTSGPTSPARPRPPTATRTATKPTAPATR
jgi:phosphatidylserine/phosphatidylglycerophosphate/cardiolipin synthase-like enzyme